MHALIDTIRIRVHARDSISEAGILAQLRHQPEVDLADPDTQETVALAVLDQADDEAVQWLRSLHRADGVPVVLVIGQLDPRTLVPVVESGVCGVLRRAEATPERLVRAVRAAAEGNGDLPQELVRHLLDHVSQLGQYLLRPRGLSFAGLTARERDVLQLVADGLSTREVANQLSYSERTIKTIIQDLTTRLHMRNRTQAVAYAVRNGWI
jgi:DNA-binding NarL/FixJ family response regulator